MIKESELKFLKSFVYAMGIVMMIGIMIITYTIYKRNILLDVNASSTILSCAKDSTVTIPESKVIKGISITGDFISILTEDNDVLIYDHCGSNLQKIIKIVQE